MAHPAAVDPRHPGADAAGRHAVLVGPAGPVRAYPACRRNRCRREPAAAVAGFVRGQRTERTSAAPRPGCRPHAYGVFFAMADPLSHHLRGSKGAVWPLVTWSSWAWAA